jgi:hypothetical protein
MRWQRAVGIGCLFVGAGLFALGSTCAVLATPVSKSCQCRVPPRAIPPATTEYGCREQDPILKFCSDPEKKCLDTITLVDSLRDGYCDRRATPAPNNYCKEQPPVFTEVQQWSYTLKCPLNQGLDPCSCLLEPLPGPNVVNVPDVSAQVNRPPPG